MKFSRLKFVATIIAGQAPSGDTVTDAGTTPFLQGCAEFGLKTPAATRYCEVASKFACKDDWLFSVRAPVGRINRSDREYGIGRGLAAIRDKSMDGLYLGFALESSAPNLSAVSTGSTYEAVSTSQIGNLLIPLPELSTQRKISAFLDQETARIDALIEKNERLIVLAGEKLRAEIDSVTQKVPGKVRVRMSKVCDYIPGKHLGVESTTTEPGDVRYLRTADLYEDMSFEKSPLWVSEPDDTELAAENDVIVCFDGFVANGKTGTLGMAVTGVNGYVGPHLAKVRVRQSQHCSDLLCLAHLGSRFSSEVVRHAEGVTARSGRRGVRYFDVYLDPDVKVQEVQAASLRDKIHKTQMLKANLKRLNVLLQEKRSALITAAVTGQIDIPE